MSEVVTEKTFNTWQEKHAEAQRLIAEVKSLNKEGIKDGETSQKAHDMVEAASKLMVEVKAEKLNEEQKQLEDLFAEFEGQLKQKGAPTDKAPVSPMKPLDAEDQKAKEAAFFNGGDLDGFTVSEKAAIALNIKALSEGTASAGGYLVPPQYLQNMFAETRRQGNALRRLGWLNVHPVQTNQVLLPKGSGAASVGWTAESATKPSADQTFAQVTVNIFTLAGISKLSKQLVDDSSPTAADLATRELGSLMGNAEEVAIINGSGTAQPRGILNTTGINAVTYTDASPTGQETIDAILDAIVAVQTNYFSEPTGILMHPRRLAFLRKAKDSQLNYLFNPAGSIRTPGAANGTPGGIVTEILGYPVAITSNMPINLGAGTNEDRIIVADWNEAHWFQRQDVTLDVSDTAGTAFEQNEVWFRLEERAGFSAERYPKAFSVVSGTGLVTPA